VSDENPLRAVHRGAVDSHCHLFLLRGEPRHAIEAANAAGVATLICVGIDPESSRRSAEYAESFRGVFATAGMHPHDASRFDASAGAAIEELLANPQVLAVGETGLDFYRMHSPREEQERVFRLHISLARETGKPLVVHCRDAWPAVLRLLDEGSADRVVLHCFSGDAAVAKECAARGYHLSFAGNVTYPNGQHLRDAAAATPVDQLLVETDSPYLAPQTLRGRDNAPANVVAVIEAIARARDEDVDIIASATATNSHAAFPGLV